MVLARTVNALSSSNTSANRRSVVSVRIRLSPSEKSVGIAATVRGVAIDFLMGVARWPNAGEAIIMNPING